LLYDWYRTSELRRKRVKKELEKKGLVKLLKEASENYPSEVDPELKPGGNPGSTVESILRHASKKLKLADPDLRTKILALLREYNTKYRKEGEPFLACFEVLRSPIRQYQVFMEGKSNFWQPGKHALGCAADLVFWWPRKGKWDWTGKLYDRKKAIFRRLARKYNLTWGGNWVSIYDPYHWELKVCKGGKLRELLLTYLPQRMLKA